MARALMWCAWVLGIRSRMRVSVMAPVVRFLALTLGASPRGGPKNRHTSCAIARRCGNRVWLVVIPGVGSAGLWLASTCPLLLVCPCLPAALVCVCGGLKRTQRGVVGAVYSVWRGLFLEVP